MQRLAATGCYDRHCGRSSGAFCYCPSAQMDNEGTMIMGEMTRQQFIRIVATAATTAAISPLVAVASGPESRIKLSTTLYSYTGEYAPTTFLDDCIANAAAMGAEGVELLSETHIPNYPNPSDRWVEHWHDLMSKHKIEPSCYDCRENSRLRKAGALPPEESLQLLIRDMELAHRLGFKILRPAWGAAGSERISAPAWQEMARKALPYAEKHNIQLAPEVDWSIGWNSRMVDAYVNLIAKTKTKRLGLLASSMLPSRAAGNELHNLRPLLPFVCHLRARFRGPYILHPERKSWERTAEPQLSDDPLKALISLLSRNSYNGYISSEYDGPRFEFLASSHLGGQHFRLKRLLQEV
jgi:sugar phosphate isomerase/epimerase